MPAWRRAVASAALWSAACVTPLPVPPPPPDEPPPVPPAAHTELPEAEPAAPDEPGGLVEAFGPWPCAVGEAPVGVGADGIAPLLERFRGRPVVLSLRSWGCLRCAADARALARAVADVPQAVWVEVAVDAPADLAAVPAPEAGAERRLKAECDEMTWAAAIDPAWDATLPQLWLFDAAGGLVERFRSMPASSVLVKRLRALADLPK